MFQEAINLINKIKFKQFLYQKENIMKKTLSLLALIVTFGSLAVIQNVSAGRDHMELDAGLTTGAHCRQQATVDPKVHQQFLDETEGLRTELLTKKGAYAELMNSPAPDKQAAQQIWSEMFDLQTQIRAKALDLGITPMGPEGDCFEPCKGMANPRCNCSKNK